MEPLYLPVLHHFVNGNVFTGSYGLLRFKITPQLELAGKEVIVEQSSMKAETWHGLLCYEKSDIEAEQTFPLTEEGRAAMDAWLNQQITTTEG